MEEWHDISRHHTRHTLGFDYQSPSVSSDRVCFVSYFLDALAGAASSAARFLLASLSAYFSMNTFI